ncbi:MAG: hypothetical protein RLZZ28_1688 [Bacteroidota bacterium]
MSRWIFFIAMLVGTGSVAAQVIDTVFQKKDSVLPAVKVTVFHSSLLWKNAAAAVAILSEKDLKSYGITSMVPVFNTVSGVRMEERSPASLRLSIRGSLLRSPFGVRNMKVYFNEIPISDAGGNTYLNLINLNQLSGVELLKGPAASAYGAGTAGTILLQSSLPYSNTPKNSFHIGISGGSYGLFQENMTWQFAAAKFQSSLLQSHQQSDGYREQSATRKDQVQWQAGWQQRKTAYRFTIFYTNLFYQTPGGITLAQMQQQPTLSRQAAGSLPGAIQQQTAVYNKTVVTSLQQKLRIDTNWTWKNFLVYHHTDFSNPFITNYETRNEGNTGLGSQIIYQNKAYRTDFEWITGAEWLHNQSLINDYGNKNGMPDTVQFKDKMLAVQWFAFTQVQWRLREKWLINAGLSLNNQHYRFMRITSPNPFYTDKNIQKEITPRISVLYKINNNISLYTIAAKGFSPPSLAELRPSDGNYYGELTAESGWNFETGIKGNLFHNLWQFDITAYFFQLKNAIVRRVNTSGAEYFVNSGGTTQNGLEAFVKGEILEKSQGFLRSWQVWTSYSFQPYRFNDYQQGTNNYSGNNVTGVPRQVWVSGMSFFSKNSWYLHTSINLTGKLPLTDANDVYADAYQLLQLKMGYEIKSAKARFDLFFGADNLMNQLYSLGNDINAAGKRYYNPAPGINVFTGIQCSF